MNATTDNRKRVRCNHATLTSPPSNPLPEFVTFAITLLVVGGLLAYALSVAVFTAGKLSRL
jgi:hypothetical protein